MAFWSKKSTNGSQTLSAIMRGMQHSVNAAHEMLELHYINSLEKFINEDGSPVAKTVKIDDTHTVSVPIMSIVNQNPLYIDELEIEFRAKINATETKELTDNNDKSSIIKNTINPTNDIDRTSFTMDFIPNADAENTANIRMKFKAGKEPEGYARILDELNKQVAPVSSK